jgi:hypothetical protein
MFIYLHDPAYGNTAFVVVYYRIEFLKYVVIKYRGTQKKQNSELTPQKNKPARQKYIHPNLI